ncbi:phage major capsid protein [Escherichia coli]|uniref:phage major capsid protein n=1 Tax=Escherichia coli TaxID=562 RepID=UPI00138625CE|nr:phage major capsid protein [Escherichia coli]MVW24255.1 phage major capsid protein [Escherichia coli]
MRALLTPEIAPRMGIVLFRPGSELMPLFMQGRVLLEPEPERYSSFASGAVPAASQPLADDPAVRAVFRNEAVIRRAGGVECLESWLLREKGCQWPHSDWHSENMTTMRHAPGAIRLCWHCDNQLRDQFTERLESMATDNCARWVLSVVRRDLGFDDSHVVTMPELCWWLVRNDLAYESTDETDKVRAFGKLQHIVSGEATAVTADAIIKLIYTLRKAHRTGAKFMMNNNSLFAIRLLKDTEGNYLWRPGLELGQPSSLAGYGIAENEQMPDIAADAKAIAFGNFKRGYTIVDRIGTRILRDPYTNKPFVGFYTTKRTGGMLVDSQAIKLLKIAAA